MSIIRSDRQIDNIIDRGIDRQIERNIIESIIVPSFSPTDLPELELWLDANSGTLNVVGNYFTDETASIELAGFPTLDSYETNNPNGTIDVNNTFNGKNFYIRQPLYTENERYRVEVFWDSTNSRWTLYYLAYSDDSGENITSLEYYATGDTQYPWQATWSDGTLTRTATTEDTLAANDETVTLWNNLVSGKPNLSQSSASLQPVFKSDVNGRKAVFFSGDVLSSSGFSTFGQQYSYYLVATNLGASSGSLFGAIRLGTSSLAVRGVFGANANYIGADNGIGRISTISNIGTTGKVWSARFNVGNNGEAIIGSNKSHQALLSVGTASANQSTILLGARNSNGTSAVTSNYSEVLVYRAFHDETTANKIIDYLAAKWGITL
jgi:hypothetical protein